MSGESNKYVIFKAVRHISSYIISVGFVVEYTLRLESCMRSQSGKGGGSQNKNIYIWIKKSHLLVWLYIPPLLYLQQGICTSFILIFNFLHSCHISFYTLILYKRKILSIVSSFNWMHGYKQLGSYSREFVLVQASGYLAVMVLAL